ncbi:MAG: dicarboxylate/amino acid:cation symporter [Acidiferrobacterales bacterium]
MSDKKIAKKIRDFLTNPKVIILGVISGFLFGFYFKPQAHALKPFGDIYVSLLSMCILPILVSALVWGIGQILRNPKTREVFPRMAVIYAAGLFIPCVIGLAVVLTFEPGARLGDEAAAALGSKVVGIQRGAEAGGFMAFIKELVPPNIFEALSRGRFISIVFFCALAGLALGVVRTKGADQTLSVVHTAYETFALIFSWVLVPLPLGLFALVASHVAEANNELLLALLTYVGYFYLAGVLIFVAYVAVLAFVSRKSPWQVLTELKTPLILAFATDNPFVALYSAIESLQERFNVDEEVANTVVPFGVLANQHGQILLFVFTAVFLAQIYDVELAASVITVGLGSIIAGTAAVGGGAVLAPIMAPILLGAGIPDVLAFVILATTQPVVAPLVSVLTVQATANLAVLSATSPSELKKPKRPSVRKTRRSPKARRKRQPQPS